MRDYNQLGYHHEKTPVSVIRKQIKISADPGCLTDSPPDQPNFHRISNFLLKNQSRICLTWEEIYRIEEKITIEFCRRQFFVQIDHFLPFFSRYFAGFIWADDWHRGECMKWEIYGKKLVSMWIVTWEEIQLFIHSPLPSIKDIYWNSFQFGKKQTPMIFRCQDHF